jgi:hypothetical protein
MGQRLRTAEGVLDGVGDRPFGAAGISRVERQLTQRRSNIAQQLRGHLGLAGADTPYVVDDTYWVLEAHRRNLGRIVYCPATSARIQEPTTVRSWYKQNLR